MHDADAVSGGHSASNVRAGPHHGPPESHPRARSRGQRPPSPTHSKQGALEYQVESLCLWKRRERGAVAGCAPVISGRVPVWEGIRASSPGARAEFGLSARSPEGSGGSPTQPPVPTEGKWWRSAAVDAFSVEWWACKKEESSVEIGG